MKQTNLYKQKIFLYLSGIIFLSLIISCGGFSKSGTSNVPVDVYVGGNSGGDYPNDRVAVYWKNGKMVPLSTKRSEVTSIAVAGNDVYMGGYYCIDDVSMMQADGDMSVPRAGYWKNCKWVGLSNTKYGSSVRAIFVSGNDVYACGRVRNREDVILRGYWKNGKWLGLGNVKDASFVAISIFVSGNDVYVGGYSKNNVGIFTACYWKNREWVALPSLNEKNDASVTSIFVSGNDVYASGYSRNNYSQIPGYWKNREWVALPSLSENKDTSSANSIFVVGNDVYVGGYSYNNSGIGIACYWKNGKIIPLLLSDPKWSSVESIFVFGRDVYAGGHSRDSGFDIPGYWKNGEWLKLDAKGDYPSVTSIVVVPRSTGQ